MRAYAQSGQYHTIVESCVRLTNLNQGKLINLVTKKKNQIKLFLKNIYKDNKRATIDNHATITSNYYFIYIYIYIIYY